MSKTEKIGRIDCSKDVPLTQQSAKDECDINLIVEAAKRGAMPTHLTSRIPFFGSNIGVPSLREALTIVDEANLAFASLDAHIRDRFQNDPVKLVEFVNDSKNRDEAIKLGLLQAPQEPDVPVVKPKASSDSKSTKAKPGGDEE